MSFRRRARVVAFAAVGAVVGVALGARIGVRVGPFDCTAVAKPSLRSNTTVRVAPLGSIQLDTHTAPVAIELRLDELRPDAAKRYAADPELLAGLDDDALADDARRALEALAAVAVLWGVVGATVGALAASLRWQSALAGAGIGLLLTGSMGGLAAFTFRPEAVAEPRYSGLLAAAPRAVGDVQAVLERFADYRVQLSGLVRNVVTLYETAERLPTFSPGDDAIRILHISDIHLNPQAFDLAEQLVDQFDVDAVVDTGDITDWGTTPESQLVSRIGRLGVPYVWVRGNHDSYSTQAAVAAQPNALVLDDDAVEVAGLRIWGIGDPRYTPDKGNSDAHGTEADRIEAFAPHVEEDVEDAQAHGAEPIDVVAVHDGRAARGLGDDVPPVLAGHNHRPRTIDLDGGGLLLVEGSTGGAGLRSLEGEHPEPLTCSVLYFNPDTRRLVAYDRITVDGFGGAGARIERHVVDSGAGEDDDGTTTTTTTTSVPTTTTTVPATTVPGG
jgi:predicted MPP superfamily phosphohydrolase